MAVTFLQLNPATATSGGLVAVDLGDLGTGTDVSVQMMKLFYGTGGVFNEVATGSGQPVAVYQWGATGVVNVATDRTYPASITNYSATGQVLTAPLASATGPVSVGTWTATGVINVATDLIYPTAVGTWTATGQVLVAPLASATGPVSVGTWTATGNVNVATDRTYPVSVTTYAATGQVLTSPLASATGPVSVGTWTATGAVNVATDRTYPVAVGTWTATGSVNVATGLTYPVSLASLPSTATVAVAVQNTATVAITGNVNANVGGRWAHDATSTGNPVYMGGIARHSRPTAVADGDVSQVMVDTLGRQVTFPFGPRGDVFDVVTTVSATTAITLATGQGTGVYADLIWMVLSNNATTEAQVRIRSTSTATKFPTLNLAPDGGGISFTPARPAQQAAANGAWDIQLAAAVDGQVNVTAEFLRTVT